MLKRSSVAHRRRLMFASSLQDITRSSWFRVVWDPCLAATCSRSWEMCLGDPVGSGLYSLVSSWGVLPEKMELENDAETVWMKTGGLTGGFSEVLVFLTALRWMKPVTSASFLSWPTLSLHLGSELHLRNPPEPSSWSRCCHVAMVGMYRICRAYQFCGSKNQGMKRS